MAAEIKSSTRGRTSPQSPVATVRRATTPPPLLRDMADFDEDADFDFVNAFTGEVIQLARRPTTVCEAAALALRAVRQKTPNATKVMSVHNDEVLRNGYPVLGGDKEIQVVVVG